ncbi:sensor histidine kinase [Radiobacillus sp. PE A8.2]|uniref:sensor histidine kinase n=1 Tax=Radiobacillus sp. PE A8.2 TaxID=3380349 RepID=UPI003890E622
MKLQYQLTAAFTTLLIVIMSVAAISIYSLLLDLLIQDEKRQLQENGEILVNLLYSERSFYNVQRLNELFENQNIQMFIYDEDINAIYYSNLPVEMVQQWAETYDFSEDGQPLWKAGNAQYVVSKLPLTALSSGMQLILVTPLVDLQAVQQTFLTRLLIIFVIGIAAAILLSHYLTKRLVTPLTRLKIQLKKIEKRKFDDIEEIKASGEIKEVEQSVLEMARELQRYIRSQRQFFQNASHELKTPLMTIQGYAEGIRDGVFEKEAAERGLEVVVAEIGRLKKIINEMILLAKLDSEENIYQEEQINVEELIKLTVDRALPLANERNIKLVHRAAPNLSLYADQQKLLQATMNIVTNAVRHASNQVLITVKEEYGIILIQIEDDGKGIAQELMPQLFQRFVKGEGGETGLGLAIARAIVERSGGSILADRSSLGGAMFTIKF